MSVEEFEGGWRPTYETCWQCKKRVRSDQAICVWCGATRVPQATRNHLWTQPEPSGEPSWQAPALGGAYGAPPMQQGAAPFSQPNGAVGPYGMAAGDYGQADGRSPLGVAVPQTGELIDPYQPAAPVHPYQFQPYQQAQAPGDWRRPPAPAQSYVPGTGPLQWEGDLSGQGQTRPAGEDADMGEDTLEHPELPRQAPPMQQLGRVRLVQENQGNGQSGHGRGSGEGDTPRAHRSVPVDRGQRQAPQYQPQPEQRNGYAPQSGPGYGYPLQPGAGYGYAPPSGPAQGYGYEQAHQPGYAGGNDLGYGPSQPGYGQQPGYDPRYGYDQSGYGQQQGYQSGYDPRYGSGQPGYGYQAGQAGYDPNYGYDQSSYGYQPGYDYGYGYPARGRRQEPPAGTFQQIVDLIWDAVHAEEALAWLEAKARRVLPYVQQISPMAEQLAPDKNMTSRRVLNLLSPIGLGCLGGFIGAVIWCSIVTAIHVEIGIFAIPMAYLIGWGVTMGSMQRGLTPAVLAVVITIGAWAICLTIISHLHLYITPMEIPFLLGALVAAVVPTRSMKREPWEKRR